MIKRIVVLCLVLCLLCSLLPQTVWAAEEKQEQKLQTIKKLQSLLVGVRFDPDRSAKVSHWKDEIILESIYGKLLWEPELEGEGSCLKEMGIEVLETEEEEVCYDLDLLLQLAFDAFGRGFAKDAGTEGVRIDDDKLWLTPAAGESERLYILDYTEMGGLMVATGMAVSNHNANCELSGYFLAEFKKNTDSAYGYTLVSLDDISGDVVTGLTASASSELKGDEKKYSAHNVMDGDSETAWLEGVDGVGIDEWVRLDSEDGSQFSFHAIELELGYHKNKKTLKRNGRPTILRIETEGGREQTVEFEEYTDALIFETPVTAGWVRFTIVEAEAGTDYDDIAISELRLSGLDSERVFEEYREKHATDPEEPGTAETLYCGDVSVTRKPGFTLDTVLEAPVLSGEEEAEVLSAFAKDELKNYAVYDLAIVHGEEEEEQKRMLEIRLPVPDPEQEGTWMVYRVQDGSHTRVQYEYADGFVILRTRELGCYVVGQLQKGHSGNVGASTEDGATDADQDEGFWVSLWNETLKPIAIGAGVVILLIICLVVVVKIAGRKKDKDQDE